MIGKVVLSIQTEYSFGKTYAPLDKIVSYLAANGVTHAGIVDNDTWGHVKWYNACKAMGITPLLGVSSIVSDVDDQIPRMWFLARNSEGLSELYQAISRSYHQKVKHRFGSSPRLYTSDVLDMSENILIFLGDIFSESFARKLAEKRKYVYADITVNGSQFINSIKLNLGLPIVDISNNSYVTAADKDLIQYLPFCDSSLKDKGIQITDIYFENINYIAALCSDLTLPRAPMIDVPGDLESECYAAIPQRFPNGFPEEYERRLQHELSEIKAKNFDKYFLLVQDMVSYSKKHMLVGPSRGSAASSLVCYLLRITEIDPIPPGLMFERFIDKSRTDLPDIDLDFPDDKREIVISYLFNRYGSSHVARLGNVTYYKPKSALLQVARMMGVPSDELVNFKKKIDFSPNDNLRDLFSKTNEGLSLSQKYPDLLRASALEGHAVRSGIHAAGVLVCNDDITKYCVIDDTGVAHLDKKDIEQLNLLKIDVLGLRTLSVIEGTGLTPDWYSLPLNDRGALDVFNSRRFCGIFQFEGNTMRSVANRMSFNSIQDIDAITALARPGPLNAGVTNEWLNRHAGARYTVESKEVFDLLHLTYGLPLYQEDTMRIVREIGEFDWAETSKVRKAISKSQGASAMAAMHDKFMFNAVQKHGLAPVSAAHLWGEITAMGAWQMNKAHTYSYAVVSYWTAWLKAYYPLEFAASTLRHAKDDESAISLLRELSLEGVKYVLFDPEKSQADWAVVDGQLVGGFKVFTGVGDSTAERLVAKRDAGQLTITDLNNLRCKGSIFDGILNFTEKYIDFYSGKANVRGNVYFLNQIPEGLPHNSERVFLGKIKSVNRKGFNCVDYRIYDDSGEINIRFNGQIYVSFAALLQQLGIDDEILVRAKFYNGYRFGFAIKVKKLA